MSTSNPANSPQSGTSEHLPSLRSLLGQLVIESLFTLVGGYLDAYAFLAHGHVFANAQTGNVVYFAVFASQSNWPRALHYLPPIAACIAGVTAANLLGVRAKKTTFKATLICQSIELLVLLGLSIFAMNLPDATIVPLLSFVAAFQFTSFGALGPWSFNSAMTTGNLRDATTGMVLWMRGTDRPRNRGKAVVAGTACLSFLIGALFGGWYTRHEPNHAHALIPCVLLVAIGILFTWRERKKMQRAS